MSNGKVAKGKRAKVDRSGRIESRSRLFPIVGIVALLLVATGAIWLAVDARGRAAPSSGVADARLVLDRSSVDFGDVPIEKVVAAKFTLTNAGTAPLSILEKPVVQVVDGC